MYSNNPRTENDRKQPKVKCFQIYHQTFDMSNTSNLEHHLEVKKYNAQICYCIAKHGIHRSV